MYVCDLKRNTLGLKMRWLSQQVFCSSK